LLSRLKDKLNGVFSITTKDRDSYDSFKPREIYMLRFLKNSNLLNLLSIQEQNIQRLTSNLPKRLISNLLKSIN
jgi:hypothetical protein